MANGPLGGFMPTPPAPSQPPQVSLDTSAESRNNFKNFLGTLPKTATISPVGMGAGLSSPAPTDLFVNNVNIFEPMQQVQRMFSGGEVDSFVDSFDDQQSFVDDDPVAGFDFDEGTQTFDSVEAPDITSDEQQQNIQDAQTFIDTPLSAPQVDTRPRTNIRNVGARSNLRFDPQFTANQLQRRGLDPQGFMAPADFAQTTQGGGTGAAPTLSSGLPSFGTGTDFLRERELDRLRPQAGAVPVTQTAQGRRVSPTQLDFGLGLALDDPFGLGFNTAGLIDSARDVQRMRGPQEFVQEARLPSVVPGAGGTLPDADPLTTDVLGAIRSGAAGLPFTRNPGALKQGQEDLTTEVVKSVPASGPITPDNLAPAIFPSLDAGIDAIDRQLSLYARNNINTPEALANTYLGSGNKENSPANRAGYIDAIKSVAGESFNLGNPATRGAIKNAIVNQEFGLAGKDVMADMRRGRDVSLLSGLNIGQLGANLPVTSDVNQLGSLDPIRQTTPSLSSELTKNVPISRGMQDLTREDQQLIAPEIFGTGRIGGVTEETFRSLPADVQQRIVSNLGDVGTPITNIDPEPNRGIVPDTALETLDARRDRPVQGPPKMPDTVLDIDTILPEDDALTTVSPDVLSSIGREQRIDDANTFRQTVPDAARIFGGRQIQTTPIDRGVDSIVGDDVVPSLDIADIQGNINQERVADILARPDRFKETFKVGDTEFPNLIAALANKAGSFFDRRLFDGIVSKGLNAVVDPDTGRIIGAKDDLGNLIEGRDLEQFQPDDGGDDPVTKFLKRATEKKDDEEEDEKPPNVIGGGAPADPTPRPPTVVKSTAPESTASFTPVGFDAGNINKLIEQITGVRSPRRLQDGGAVGAVDRFLSKVA